MKEIPIYEIPKSKKYWLVKTDSGDIYNHFITFGVMAIGHLDILNFSISPSTPFYPNKELLKKHLTTAHEKLERKKGYTTNHLAQINTFIYELNIGDWVLAKGTKYVSVGRIVGSPLINRQAYTLEIKKKNKVVVVEMDYSLRRAVNWGPKIETKHLPHALKYSLGARQSLYNIDKHAIAIHHMLYPYFRSNDDLYLSFKILKEKDIDNFSITKLLTFLNELEVISKTIDTDTDYDIDTFQKEFNSFVQGRQFELSTKAGFYSEGDIWAKLGFNNRFKSHRYMLYGIVIYGMIFGNSHLGMEGILDVESRQKLWNVVVQRLEANLLEEVVDNLQLESPSFDTKSIETNERDEDSSVKILAVKQTL